ncbi:uncharacterized protein LOC113367064 [Ctenocephalides felis]|uniref:uncharacterized protein LOC113367064 n=1 Tax=Ctenocephalides felis TaxID=7515 RepID=UPI000E6E4F6F|nr:uncharacterized protein LOC113367064 [Ctenocephalides felis]
MALYWIDRETAVHVDQRIQRGLFLFACANSCANPIVYGAYNIRAKRQQTQLIVNRVHDRSGSVPRLSSSGAQAILAMNQINSSIHLGDEFQTMHQLSKSVHQRSFIREPNRRAICLSCGESLDLPSLDGSTRNGLE